MLKTPDLGSLDTGTPIFFRRLQVGEVASYALDKDGKALDRQGLRQRALRPVRHAEHALLAGERHRRVALRQRPHRADAVAALHPGRRHRLRDARRPVRSCRPAEAETVVHALQRPRRGLQACRRAIRRPTCSSSSESVRGLTPRRAGGVPRHPDRRGDRHPRAGRRRRPSSSPCRSPFASMPSGSGVEDAGMHRRRRSRTLRTGSVIDALVAHGVRAQLRSGSLLTGALFVALRLLPRRAAGDGGLVAGPGRSCRPSRASSRRSRRTSSSIIKKLDKMPLKAIGDDLRRRSPSSTRRSSSARGTLGNADAHARQRRQADRAELACSAQQLGNTLQEVSRAARGAARARRLSRAPSRGAHSRQARGGASDGGALPRIGSRSCSSRWRRWLRLRHRAVALLHPRRRRRRRTARRRRATPSSSGRSRCPRRSTGRSSSSQVAPEPGRRSTSSTAGPRRSTTASRASSPATSRRCSARRTSRSAPLANFDPAYRVTIDVQRFDSIPGQAVLVDAVWAVRGARRRRTRARAAPSRARRWRTRASTRSPPRTAARSRR